MSSHSLVSISINLLILLNAFVHSELQSKKTYIVHMDNDNMPSEFADPQEWYSTSLKALSSSARMLYTYDTVIHGYSTQLTAEEAKSLQEQPGVLLVQEGMIYKLHTTRSPEFLGIDKIDAHFAELNITTENVIIGFVDSGVWPESKGFDDTGLGPIPSSWKGECEAGTNFSSSNCNRKLIGARFFLEAFEARFGPINETEESRSPRDDDGHGTHTSTTAAGSAVAEASLFGYASGRARGMATQARVAMYKACWGGGLCATSDILAAVEKAIKDGVNILSVSLGGGPVDYYQDLLAIGAFRATSRGIFVSCSAGNQGPEPYSISNSAPWITTVGAGTIDREFPAYVILGNGQNITGVSLYGGKPLPNSFIPLVYASDVSNAKHAGEHFLPGTLLRGKVSGEIVFCNSNCKSLQSDLKDAGAAGVILSAEDDIVDLISKAPILPAVNVHQTAGNMINVYMSSHSNPMATLVYGNTQLGVQPSPVVESFSSRGPNSVSPAILKPDILAPGVNILAGWTRRVGPSPYEKDTRRVDFNIISGTSMSCPHVSGIAALLKAAHPEWSPAAVRSALMTTAYSTYQDGLTIKDAASQAPSTPFDHGAGYVNPALALDPGLVYDATGNDYIDFLCASNYSSEMIKLITHKNYTCKESRKFRVGNLNYPSFVVPFSTTSRLGQGTNEPTTVTYTRTLTNVGNPATYKVFVQEIKDVEIQVEPDTLHFSKANEKKTFTVTFTVNSAPSGTTSFTHLVWTDGIHVVRSPIAFSWT